MTDPVQNNSPISPLPQSVEPWSMEQDADHLMDDLFANVDVLLEGSSSQLPNQLAQPPAEKLPTVPVTVTAVTAAPPATRKPPRTLRTRTRAAKSNGASGSPADMTWPTRAKAWRTRLWANFDKVCFGVACVSFGSAVIWFVHQSRPSTRAVTSGSTPNAFEVEQIMLSQEDAQFAQYMLRSLRVIGRQPSQAPVTAQRSSQATASADPTQTDAAASPQVIERIYIPVYPPNPPTTAQAPDNAANATPEAPKAPEPLPRVPTPDQLSRRVETPIPSLEDNSANESAVETNSSAEVYVPNLPAGENKLIGIIQAGDRTTVLFKVGETTQRVELGEEIGSSGWTLVSAESNNQSVVIRRNGTVHSITSDQSF